MQHFFHGKPGSAKDCGRVRMHRTIDNHDDDKRRRANQVIIMTVDQ